MAAQVKRGDRLIAYPDAAPKSRLFVEVTRVAKDGTWADIKVCNCFVMWTKRQRLPLPECVAYAWTMEDIDQQHAQWDDAA
jgi:hypothetical protein